MNRTCFVVIIRWITSEQEHCDDYTSYVCYRVSSAENITVFPIGKPVKQNGEKLCGVINNLHILAAVRKESQVPWLHV